MYRLTILLPLLWLALGMQGAASADAKASLLMQQAAAAARRTQSVSAILTLRQRTDDAAMEVRTGKVYLQKPNRAHVEVALSFGGMYGVVNSDGKRVWQRTADNSQPGGLRYRSVPADKQGKNIDFYYALPVAFFFNQLAPFTTMFAVDKVGDLHYAGQKVIDGVRYDVVEQEILQPSPYTVRLYINSDKQLSRVETAMPKSLDTPHHQYFEADFSQVHLNQPIQAQKFAFTPDTQFSSSAAPNSASRLPAVGMLAPDFSLVAMNGKSLTLQEALRGKKAIYLDFWFCECAVCRHEFPALQRLYTASKAQGLEIYAVNAFDDAAKVRRFKSQMDLLKSATFPIVLTGPGDPDGIVKKYGVDGYPSGILIGTDGRVLFTSIGYEDKSGLRDLKAALVKAGISTH